MKQDIQNSMGLVNVNVDQMQVLVLINDVEILINADVNVKNSLKKEDVMKDLFGSLVKVKANLINHVMLDNIQIMKVVSVKRNKLIIQLKNVLKILMEIK